MRVTVGFMFQYANNENDPLWVMQVREVGGGIAYCESFNGGSSTWSTADIREGIKGGWLTKFEVK